MSNSSPIRWGILSTARIAASSFLPALRAAGGGVAYAVASRSLERAQAFAHANGIDHAVPDYDSLLADPEVDAVYNPLPNSMHAGWTIAALQAGKAVLCEKPLCTSVEDTRRVLEAVRETGCLLWEAFVFPFHRQMERVREIIASGEMGEIREVQSSFHFQLQREGDIRLSRELGGGGLNDVGCYCARLAQFVFESQPERAVGVGVWGGDGVDVDAQCILSYPGDRRLVLSCGMSGPYIVYGTLLGREGWLHMTSPFHPGEHDRLEIHRGGQVTSEQVAMLEPSFTPALRHIHAALTGEAKPIHLAVDDSMSTAVALDLARGSIR